MTREEIVDSARSWVGVPYLHQGRTRKGVDCIGLLACIAKQFQISDYDETDYGRRPSGLHMRRVLQDNLQPIALADLREADILHMATDNEPLHVAVVSRANPLYIIHSSSDFGKVIEQRLDDVYVRRLRACYRIPGIA